MFEPISNNIRIDRARLRSIKELQYSKLTQNKKPKPKENCFSDSSEAFNSNNTNITSALPPMNTFQCTKKKSTNIRGSHFKFHFIQNGHIIYSAKFKSSNSRKFIPIVEGQNVHLRSNNIKSALLFTNNMSDYSLRKNSKFGEEVLSIQFRRYKVQNPRSLIIYFFQQSNSIPSKLISANPQFNPINGKYIIDLGKEALPSPVNSRIENEKDHSLWAYIRKIQKHVIEIEARSCIDNISLFAIVIASFLCKS